MMARGMRDGLPAARANRPDLFNSNWDPSPPLIQRRNILEVGERVDYEGTVPTELSEDDVRNAARKSRRAALRRSARWACLRPRGLSSRRWHDLRATRHTSAATPIAGGGMGWPLEACPRWACLRRAAPPARAPRPSRQPAVAGRCDRAVRRPHRPPARGSHRLPVRNLRRATTLGHLLRRGYLPRPSYLPRPAYLPRRAR